MSSEISRLSGALADRYSIDREIGAGGMATVYLARDIKHNRRVALKLLKPELGAVLGVERFLSEIKVTANLQHPNLLPLFDSGEAAGLLYYVMPFVEGESLRARLDREKQLPVDEAVRLATAIAAALDYAHRNGVIHRDLKPENILLQDGQPVIADFGIALAVSNAGGARVTQTGLSLGTPQYMSPEQATGDRAIDARSDIYSLAAVTYEMLVGDPPYLGSTAQAIIAKVLTERPPSVRVARAAVPEHVAYAIECALEKLPADRWATAQEFADALAGKLAARATAHSRTHADAPRWYASPLPWAGALVVALAALGWTARVPPRGAAAIAEAVRFNIAAPSDGFQQNRAIAISPDGRKIAFIARTRGKTLIHVRELGSLSARALEGTEKAGFVTFSPDSRWIAFQTSGSTGELYKIAVDGSNRTSLAQPGSIAKRFSNGLAWIGDAIVASHGGWLYVVPAAGGVAVAMNKDTTEAAQNTWLPCAMPDGRTILFTTPAQEVFAASLADRKFSRVNVQASRVLGLVDGMLVYVSDGTVMAVPFDARRLRATGAPSPLESGVQSGGREAWAAAISPTGVLAMFVGSAGTQVSLVDFRGGATPLITEPQAYSYPRFSPDGRRVAVSVSKADGTDVYVYEVDASTFARLTTEGRENDRAEWTPDGKRVIFRRVDADRRINEEIWWQPADKSGPAERLLGLGAVSVPEGMLSPDGKTLLYRTIGAKTGRDIWYKRLEGDTTAHPFEVTPFDELMPRFSPDGHWVVFESNESGMDEVYVRPFPGPGGRVQVSTGGGLDPVWSPDGKRIYYIGGSDFVAANVGAGATFTIISREKLFAGDFTSGNIHASYDVSRDGKHFLMVRPVGQGAELTVVVNWATDVKRRLAAGVK